MANTRPSEIATTLTLAAMKSGAIDSSAEAVGEYYKAVYVHIASVLPEPESEPQEYVFRWLPPDAETAK